MQLCPAKAHVNQSLFFEVARLRVRAPVKPAPSEVMTGGPPVAARELKNNPVERLAGSKNVASLAPDVHLGNRDKFLGFVWNKSNFYPWEGDVYTRAVGKPRSGTRRLYYNLLYHIPYILLTSATGM